MADLNDVLQRDTSITWNAMNKRVDFNNGEYWMSIQASQFHYCSPRITTFLSDYTHFEIMMSVPEHLIPEHWDQYSDGSGVYGFVPREDIENFIDILKDYCEITI